MRRSVYSIVFVTTLTLCGLHSAPACAQDWLASPTPAVPLHVPIAPPTPAPPAVPPPATVAPSTPVVPHVPDTVNRLLDPYGLSHQLPSAPSTIAPLPAIWFAPTATGTWPRADAFAPRMIAPPLLAFPQTPITWLLGF